MTSFRHRIRPHVDAELAAADAAERRGDYRDAFGRLERAHILGQASTAEHVRVHARMLGWALRRRDVREAFGQAVRIVGAATKTAIGWVPHGNTGGSRVSPFRPMPVPPELEARIRSARRPPGA